MSTSMRERERQRERESYFLRCDYLFVLQLQMLLYFFFSLTSFPATFLICFPFSPYLLYDLYISFYLFFF